jgi:hypothetical protein
VGGNADSATYCAAVDALLAAASDYVSVVSERGRVRESERARACDACLVSHGCGDTRRVHALTCCCTLLAVT